MNYYKKVLKFQVAIKDILILNQTNNTILCWYGLTNLYNQPLYEMVNKWLTKSFLTTSQLDVDNFKNNNADINLWTCCKLKTRHFFFFSKYACDRDDIFMIKASVILNVISTRFALRGWYTWWQIINMHEH